MPRKKKRQRGRPRGRVGVKEIRAEVAEHKIMEISDLCDSLRASSPLENPATIECLVRTQELTLTEIERLMALAANGKITANEAERIPGLLGHARKNLEALQVTNVKEEDDGFTFEGK